MRLALLAALSLLASGPALAMGSEAPRFIDPENIAVQLFTEACIVPEDSSDKMEAFFRKVTKDQPEYQPYNLPRERWNASLPVNANDISSVWRITHPGTQHVYFIYDTRDSCIVSFEQMDSNRMKDLFKSYMSDLESHYERNNESITLTPNDAKAGVVEGYTMHSPNFSKSPVVEFISQANDHYLFTYRQGVAK